MGGRASLVYGKREFKLEFDEIGDITESRMRKIDSICKEYEPLYNPRAAIKKVGSWKSLEVYSLNGLRSY